MVFSILTSPLSSVETNGTLIACVKSHKKILARLGVIFGRFRRVIHTASETRLKLRRVKVVDVEKSKSLSRSEQTDTRSHQQRGSARQSEIVLRSLEHACLLLAACYVPRTTAHRIEDEKKIRTIESTGTRSLPDKIKFSVPRINSWIDHSVWSNKNYAVARSKCMEQRRFRVMGRAACGRIWCLPACAFSVLFLAVYHLTPHCCMQSMYVHIVGV